MPTTTATEESTGTATEESTPTATPTPSPASFSEWPTFMYNNQNWGNHPDAVGPHGDVTVAWQRDLGAAQVNATPVLANGTLYVGDGRPTDDTGTLYALNPVTGETNWTLDMSAPVLGGTTVDENGNLYIGAGQDVLGLREDGSELWSFQINSDTDFTSPTISGDHVYFGADSGRVFKRDTLSSTGQWTFTASGTISAAPVVGEENIYAASRDGSVYAIEDDSANPALDWEYDANSPLNGLSMRDGSLFAAVERGEVIRLDDRGNRLWRQPTGAAAATTPALSESLLYVGTRGNSLIALDRVDGVEQWRFSGANNQFSAPPVVVDGTVYVGSRDGNVYALDASSGEVEWSFETNNSIVDPAPVVSGNTVFIGSRDGNVYALSG